VTRHTIGAYFRLFANDVLPDTVEHIVYMDTDVVVMTNLGDLWERIDRNATLLPMGQRSFLWICGIQCSKDPDNLEVGFGIQL